MRLKASETSPPNRNVLTGNKHQHFKLRIDVELTVSRYAHQISTTNYHVSHMPTAAILPEFFKLSQRLELLCAVVLENDSATTFEVNRRESLYIANRFGVAIARLQIVGTAKINNSPYLATLYADAKAISLICIE